MKNVYFIGIFILVQTVHVISQNQIILIPDNSAGIDARIQSNIPDVNIAATQFFSAQSGTISGEPFIDRSLINFNLIDILPANVVILEAKLSLFANTLNGGHTEVDGVNDCWLEKISEPWQEETVTWNNQPATLVNGRISLENSDLANQDYLDIDITSWVNEMYSDTPTCFGILIKLKDETARRSMQFGSSDAPNANIRPQLSITYLETTSCVKLGTLGVDARIQSNIPDNNISNSQLISAQSGTINGIPFIDRSLFNFNLGSVIPSSSEIVQARLSLYANTINGGHSNLDGSNQSELIKISGEWSESSVTWNTQPSLSEQKVILNSSEANDQHYYNIDVTTMVQYMFAEPNGGNGFMLKLTSESDRRSMQFASSDASDNTIHPQLEVCYNNISNIVEYDTDDIINVFPNPTSETITLNLSKVNCSRITIVDGKGNRVGVYNVDNAPELNLNISNYTNGVYYLLLNTDKNIITKQIIKL